nr:MAG TPA: hypothetical protein [Crassvirales sp.]
MCFTSSSTSLISYILPLFSKSFFTYTKFTTLFMKPIFLIKFRTIIIMN